MFAMNIPADGGIPGNGVYVFNEGAVRYFGYQLSASTTSFTTGTSTIGVTTSGALTATAPEVNHGTTSVWVSRAI